MGNSVNSATSTCTTTVAALDDPRSPSKDVSRTPLRIGSNGKQQQRIDPRSPSGYIDRTPIQISDVHKDKAEVKVSLNYENSPPQLNMTDS